MNELREVAMYEVHQYMKSDLDMCDMESLRRNIRKYEALQDETMPVHEAVMMSTDEFVDHFCLEYKNAVIREEPEELIANAAEVLRQAYEDVFGAQYDTFMNVLLTHVCPDLLDALQAV